MIISGGAHGVEGGQRNALKPSHCNGWVACRDRPATPTPPLFILILLPSILPPNPSFRLPGSLGRFRRPQVAAVRCRPCFRAARSLSFRDELMRWTASAFGLASVFGLAWGALAADPTSQTAEHYLARWAKMSQRAAAPDLDQYADRYGDEYPETVLKYMAAFFGPVEQKGLETTFRWSVMEVRDGEVRLRATPRSHDALAATATDSQANTVAPIGATERTGGMLAFDVVFDTAFTQPRLVSWLGPGEKTPREAVARLFDIKEPEETRRFRGGWLNEKSDGVAQASATVLNAEFDATTVSPVVQEILSRWEQASQELQLVEINFKRFDRDTVFEVETRGVGKFIYVAPNIGLYSLKGAPVVERAEGPSAASGGRMVVAAAKPQLYWWSGENVTIIDEREKTYDTLPIPKRM